MSQRVLRCILKGGADRRYGGGMFITYAFYVFMLNVVKTLSLLPPPLLHNRCVQEVTWLCPVKIDRKLFLSPCDVWLSPYPPGSGLRGSSLTRSSSPDAERGASFNNWLSQAPRIK